MTTQADIKTSSLGFRDLKPCCYCRGPIVPMFYVLEIKHAVIDLQNTRNFAGLMTMFNNNIGLAEVFTAGPAAQVLEEAPRRIFICSKCLIKLPTEILRAFESSKDASDNENAG